jgi:hypothetical protein
MAFWNSNSGSIPYLLAMVKIQRNVHQAVAFTRAKDLIVGDGNKTAIKYCELDFQDRKPKGMGAR